MLGAAYFSAQEHNYLGKTVTFDDVIDFPMEFQLVAADEGSTSPFANIYILSFSLSTSVTLM